MAGRSQQLHIFLLSTLIAAAVISITPVKALGAGKADDVFVDEGDGDFDSAPAPSKQTFNKTEKSSPKKAKPAAPPPEPVVEAAAPAPQPPVATESAKSPDVVVPEKELTEASAAPPAATKEASDDSSVTNPAPQAKAEESASPTAAPAAKAPKALPKKVATQKKANSHASHQHHKMTKKEAGIYVVTTGPCAMNRAPASESEAMMTVKASKKIWVQEVDEKWVRAFNKAGEAGYVARDCVQETK